MTTTRKPAWIKAKGGSAEERQRVHAMLARLSLNTVCQEASCPNMMECFGRRTATFMIMGKICTRGCTFCDVGKGGPTSLDASEPDKVGHAVAELGLKHAVITSVTRDDLPDGGAAHFAAVIAAVRLHAPTTAVEVLIPDLQGDRDALRVVLAANPDILNHNIETVPRLYPEVRPQAQYQRSLSLLLQAKEEAPHLLTKSGIMTGLGETPDEVTETMKDLRAHKCDILTIGQYLAPSREHHPVVEYITPEQFDAYAATARSLGFTHVASGPLVRSSYLADQAIPVRSGSKDQSL